MVCSACGCEQVAGNRFCRQCGAGLAPAAPPFAQHTPPPAYQPGIPPFATYAVERQRIRLRQNVQPLGIMWIVFGILRLLTGLIGALVLHNLAYSGLFTDAPPFLPHLLGGLVHLIAILSVVMGVASILIGWALLARQPWARIAAIVLGVLELLKIPFGTALGIYTLWVLVPGAAGAEWDLIAREA